MPEAPKDTVRMEMGYTHDDFIRTVGIFMDGRPYSVSGSRIVIPGADRRVDISLGAQGVRKIGPIIKLPKTPVEIVFSGYAEEDRKRFMERFEMIFRRGGG